MSNATAIPTAPDEATGARAEIRRMAVLFGVVYFAEGICQVILLLRQPLNYFFRQSLNYPADRIAAFFAVVTIPWMVKPLYGLLSDFVPVAGYRRKSYLLGMNLLAAAAFVWAFGLRDPGALLAAMMLTGVGVAASDVVVDALMVESGQRTGRVKLFQGVQWTCVSLATIVSALLGGYLCQRFAPDRAYRAAALIAASVAAVVAVLAWFLVREPKSRLDLPQLKATARGVRSAFTSVRLWLVMLYLLLAHFNPGMVTPLYLHLTERMGFSQAAYGRLDAVASAGYVAGAFVFTVFVARRLSTRGGIAFGLLAFSAGTLAYLGLRGPKTAVLASFCYGVGYMLNNLALLSLAAEACPERAEGFTFAAMMSVLNVAMQGADVAGSWLYEHATHKTFWPLPVISAGITLVAVALLPLLSKPAHAPDRYDGG